MKGLVLKDIYSVERNIKLVFPLLAVIVIIMYPAYGIYGCIAAPVITLGRMISTTFSHDEYSDWIHYAVIMPVSRKNIALSKYIVLAIFCGLGTFFGIIVGLGNAYITGGNVLDIDKIAESVVLLLGLLAITFFLGSVEIPLTFKFGEENASMIITVSMIVIYAVSAGTANTFDIAELEIPGKEGIPAACVLLLIAAVWGCVMCYLSYKVLLKKDL